MLPIEFARISDDGRLTLVIHAGSKPQQTYWAISECRDLDRARENLKEREGCVSLDAIAYRSPTGAAQSVTSDISAIMRAWLSTHTGVEAVIWTGLSTNWQRKFQTEFTVNEAANYLEGLENERQATDSRFKRAREYLANAPAPIQTEVRKRMHEKGWTDAKLAEVLFEEGR
ncbi:MAG TPA: hypothetical protein VIY69_01275 [Candidatus Acidoferrales bacterium]